MEHRFLTCGVALILLMPPVFVLAAEPGAVVINEVAWMGTEASSFDEWIELFNTTDAPVDIANWSIFGADSGECLDFDDADQIVSTVIPARGYLLYANGDDEVVDAGGGSLVDVGDSTISLNNGSPGHLELYDAPGCTGTLVDALDASSGWPAGDNDAKATMERANPFDSGADANWCTNDGITHNGFDADDNPINGTPKARNSCTKTATLTVNRTGSGTGEVESALGAIHCGATCSAAFISDTPLTLTATPGPDATFAGWSGCDAVNGGACELSLNADRTVQATFELAGGGGDVDDNGRANVIDARICLRFALGLNALDPDEQGACDVDGDGAITRADAEQIARHDIGQPSALALNAVGWSLVGVLGGAWWVRRRRSRR